VVGWHPIVSAGFRHVPLLPGGSRPNTTQISYELLRCYKAALKNERWINKYLENGLVIRAITLAFATREEQCREMILEMLTTFCHLSQVGFSQVLAAWADYQRQTGERLKYQSLVQVLMVPEPDPRAPLPSVSPDIRRTSLFGLPTDPPMDPSPRMSMRPAITSMIPAAVTHTTLNLKRLTMYLLLHLVNADDLVDRVIIRSELVQCGLLTAMDELRQRLDTRIGDHIAATSATAKPGVDDVAVLLSSNAIDVIHDIEGNIDGFVEMMNEDNRQALEENGVLVGFCCYNQSVLACVCVVSMVVVVFVRRSRILKPCFLRLCLQPVTQTTSVTCCASCICCCCCLARNPLPVVTSAHHGHRLWQPFSRSSKR
jgi:hypothetical protein